MWVVANLIKDDLQTTPIFHNPCTTLSNPLLRSIWPQSPPQNCKLRHWEGFEKIHFLCVAMAEVPFMRYCNLWTWYGMPPSLLCIVCCCCIGSCIVYSSNIFPFYFHWTSHSLTASKCSSIHTLFAFTSSIAWGLTLYNVQAAFIIQTLL